MLNILEQFSISTESTVRAMSDINGMSDEVANEALAALGLMPEEDAEASTMLTHAAIAIIKGEENVEEYVDRKMEAFRNSGRPASSVSARPRAGLMAFTAPAEQPKEPVIETPAPEASESEQGEPEQPADDTLEVTSEPAQANDGTPAPVATVKSRGRPKLAETAYDRAARVMAAYVAENGKGKQISEVLAHLQTEIPELKEKESSARVYISLYNKANGEPFSRSTTRAKRASGSQTAFDRAVEVIEAELQTDPNTARAALIQAVMDKASIGKSSAGVYVSRYYTERKSATDQTPESESQAA